MPEWQGAGCGTKFLEFIAEYHKEGNGRCSKKLPCMFHTSHPQLIGYLKASKKWVLKSQALFGGVKKGQRGTPDGEKKNKALGKAPQSGYGGHFRAVQGFKYMGTK